MSTKDSKLTHFQLKSLFNYCPTTGCFTRVSNGNRAGWTNKDGYRLIQIRIDGKDYKFYEQRLAIFYMTGQWPNDKVDHIDLNRQNNIYENLRPSNQSQNLANQSKRKNNSTGYKGIYSENGKFRVKIMSSGKRINVGTYVNVQEAIDAYKAASLEFHGPFGRR